MVSLVPLFFFFFFFFFSLFSFVFLFFFFFFFFFFFCFFVFCFCLFCFVLFWKELAIDYIVVFILAMMLSLESIGTHLCNKAALTLAFATKLYQHPSLLWSHTDIHLCNKATLENVFAIKPYCHSFLQWIHTGIYLWKETILVCALKEWINHHLFQGILPISPLITQPL